MVPRENAHAPFGRELYEAAEDHDKRQHAAHALAQKRCPRNARNTHIERRDEQNIDCNIGGRRAGEENKRRFGVAQRGENAGCDVVEEHKRKPVDVYIQIQLRVGKNFFRRFDEPKQTVAAERADEHQDRADHAAGNERRVDRRFEVIVLLRAKKQRRQNRTRDVAAEGKGDEDQRNFVAVADGGKGVVTDEFPRHEAVGDIIKLLEDDAAEQWQAELPEDFFRLAGRQILIHGASPPARMQ